MSPADACGRGAGLLASRHNLIALPPVPLQQVLLPAGFQREAPVRRERILADDLARLLDEGAIRDDPGTTRPKPVVEALVKILTPTKGPRPVLHGSIVASAAVNIGVIGTSSMSNGLTRSLSKLAALRGGRRRRRLSGHLRQAALPNPTNRPSLAGGRLDVYKPTSLTERAAPLVGVAPLLGKVAAALDVRLHVGNLDQRCVFNREVRTS